MLSHRDQFGFLAEEFSRLWTEYGTEPAFGRDQLALRLELPETSSAELVGEGDPSSPLYFLRDCAANAAAEQLLTKIIEAMKWRRENVYLLTVEEFIECRPKVLVALGEKAVAQLLSAPLAQLRGKFRPSPWDAGVMIMPTLCPSLLLKNPEAKKLLWEDMKLVVAYLEANP